MDNMPEGLRIEVDNDLYQSEPEANVTDEILEYDVQIDDDDLIEAVIKDNEGDEILEVNILNTSISEEIKEDGEISDAKASPDDMEEPMDVDIQTELVKDPRNISPVSGDIEHIIVTRRSSGVSGDYMGYMSRPILEPKPRRYPNPYMTVSEEKLSSRAVRFGLLDANEMKAPEKSNRPSDEDLLDLYLAVGLIADDGGLFTLEKVDPKHRLNSILIRGTNAMSTNEIFKYLCDNHQRPLEMEWVNDACCVVIYKDNYEAAASLINMTKPILIESLRKNSQVLGEEIEDTECSPGNKEKADESMQEDFDFHKVEFVPSRIITVPMPPGYVWRFSVPCEKAKGILMRFANTGDKKQERAERHSEYYKKHGNPNYNGSPTVHTSKRMKKLKRESSLQSDNSEAESPVKPTLTNKNAWAVLSANWEKEEHVESKRWNPKDFRQQNRTSMFSDKPQFQLSRPKTLQVVVNYSSGSDDARVKTRLKRKREESSSDEDGEVREDDELNRDRDADDEDEDSDDGINWTEKLRAPLMRMHADEEEEKIRRKSVLKRTSKSGLKSKFTHDREMEGNRLPMAERLGVLRSPRDARNLLSRFPKRDGRMRSDNTDSKRGSNDSGRYEGYGFARSKGKYEGPDLREKLDQKRRGDDELEKQLIDLSEDEEILTLINQYS